MNLLTLSSWLMYVSAFLVLGGLFGVFLLEGLIPIGWLILGHATSMIAAVGLKIGYVLRLEALSRVDIS